VNRLRRRSFLKQLGMAMPLAAVQPLASAQESAGVPDASPSRIPSNHELQADLVIIGGGLGGCAAALAAARNGLRVIMTEETDWIGGQLAAQAVPPDENPWVETFGATRSYLELRNGIRDYYLRNYPLTTEARAKPHLNPGNGSVSRLCHEPRVALSVLEAALAPFLSSQRVRILLRHRALDSNQDRDRAEAVRVRSLESGNELVLRGAYFADATELGDLLPLTKTEYVTGAESQKETGEPHAPDLPASSNQQAFTCCFAIDYLAGENHTIDKPPDYAFWRDFVPRLKPAWPGRLFSLDAADPVSTKPKRFQMDPEKGTGLWSYRRIIDRSQFATGAFSGDISLINWPQNDFLLGNLCEVTSEEAARNLARAKQLSLSLLYWLQTEAPRPDGGTGWPGLRLRSDIVGTEDGLAKYPYIRESRRIRAEFTVLEQHVGTDCRLKETSVPRDEVRAATFSDSVGIGSYRIDLHPSTGGDNYLDISSLPFQIPLGALVPRRVENLLPACKNLGVTHITNGCYRLHPVEWNIGEAVGALSAFCLRQRTTPRAVLNKPRLLRDFQALLEAQGVPLAWPRITPR
jgi:FAD-dependent oxidoreductase family protein